MKHPPVPHGNNVVISTTIREKEGSIYVALRYESKIDIWLLGETIKVNANAEEAANSVWKNKYLPLKEDAKKLLTLNSKDNIPIMNFDFASNGSMLAYITSDGSVRIFQLCLNPNTDDKKSLPQITKIPFKSQQDSLMEESNNVKTPDYNIVKLLSSPAESKIKLLLSTSGGSVQCYEITIRQDNDPSIMTALWSLSPSECLDIHSGISHLEVHSNGLSCAIASYDGSVRLINMQNKTSKGSITNDSMAKPTVHKVPNYNLAIVSSMAFSPKVGGNLIIVYANHHFVEVNVSNGQYTDFTNKLTNLAKKDRQLPKEWNEKQFSTKAVSFLSDTKSNAHDNELIVFCDEGNISTFDKKAWLNNYSEAQSTDMSNKRDTNGPSQKSAKKTKGNKI